MLNKAIGVLGSIRFWQLVIVAVVGILVQEGIIDQTIGTALITLFGGSVVVGTVDRFADKMGK